MRFFILFFMLDAEFLTVSFCIGNNFFSDSRDTVRDM